MISFWRLNVDYSEEEKLLGDADLSGSPHRGVFYLQKPYKVLILKIQKDSLLTLAEEGKQ